MAEPDTRRWSLRSPGAETCSNNIPTATLVQWANLGTIKPGYALSADGETWVPAETLQELQMTWYVLAPGRAPYGPIAKAAAEHFIAAGHFPVGSKITQDPGSTPVSIELPLPIEVPPDTHEQELEETRKRLVLLERELRQKDKRIEELRQEVVVRQTELNVEGQPDVKSLTQELEALRLEHRHLQADALEAKESAAEHERTLHQRIATLEAALEAAQNASIEQAPITDATLFAVLSHEADILRKSQEEEERYLDQLRELSRQRLMQFSARLLEIHQMLGGSPDQMRVLNTPHAALPPQIPLAPRVNEHTAELEHALAAAREREAALQRQLVAREGEEAHLRTQVSLAEKKTLEALKLDEKLRDTVEALERERKAREEEHRESAHIQAQLIRRIEELERIASGMPPQPIVPDPDATKKTSSFGWLRKR